MDGESGLTGGSMGIADSLSSVSGESSPIGRRDLIRLPGSARSKKNPDPISPPHMGVRGWR